MTTIWCFNSRARKGRDTLSYSTSDNSKCFNSRARKGRDAPDSPHHRADKEFQFTRPQGARHGKKKSGQAPSCFNSRARKGRDSRATSRERSGRGFNSRARKGRDVQPCRQCVYKAEVSIHAPARGATSGAFREAFFTIVSIHAPARGATVEVFEIWDRKLEFQFTRPQGARPAGGRGGGLRPRPVSIHAPARGATYCCSRYSYCCKVSIHAPARGATSPPRTTSSRGASFNSRARKGRDPLELESLDSLDEVSIHAPARGATGLRHRPAPPR